MSLVARIIREHRPMMMTRKIKGTNPLTEPGTGERNVYISLPLHILLLDFPSFFLVYPKPNSMFLIRIVAKQIILCSC